MFFDYEYSYEEPLFEEVHRAEVPPTPWYIWIFIVLSLVGTGLGIYGALKK